jgi:hypothetical protein
MTEIAAAATLNSDESYAISDIQGKCNLEIAQYFAYILHGPRG